MQITIPAFFGEVPRADKRFLPHSAAQRALNCRLENGRLAPLRKETLSHTFGAPVASFTRFNGAWVGFNTATESAPGPVTDNRLYYTGDGAPKIRVSGVSRGMALPPPVAAPTVEVTGLAGEGLEESIVYAYTCVTNLGEESAPSPLSDAVLVTNAQGVTLSGLANPAPSRGITKYRIYRSQTSVTGATDLYYIAEAAVAETSVSVAALQTAQEPLTTLDFGTPPDAMRGIINMPNGIMAAHNGHELLFSEPFMPYAWPDKYRVLVDHAIVGLCAFGTNVTVLTTGMPYRAQGTHPDNIQLDQVEEMVPCLAARGIVDLGYAAAYPSSDGLITITASGAQNMTRPLFTRDQWAAMNPASFIAALFNGRYMFSYLPAGETNRRLGIIDLTGKALFFVRCDVIADDLYYDVTTGNLYVLIGSAALYLWDGAAGAPELYEWRSKVFTVPFETNFGCIRIEGQPAAASPAFAAEVYAGGVLRHTISDLNTNSRLPGGFLADQWEIRITGNATVERAIIASTMNDLVEATMQ